MAIYSTAAEYKKAAKEQIKSGTGLSISALTSIGKTGQEGNIAFEELLTGGKTAQTVDLGADTTAISDITSGKTTVEQQAKKNVGEYGSTWANRNLTEWKKKYDAEVARLNSLATSLQ